MVKRYYSDVREALKFVFNSDLNGKRGIKSRGADRVSCIVGYEGTGKSNFALIHFEEWYKALNKSMTEEDIKYVCATPSHFGKMIKDPKELDMLTLDEGVLFSYARTGLSQTNILVNQMLMVCRGEHLYIVTLIPNFLDLDPYLRKNRVTALWVMMPDYKVAYFSRKRVRELLGRLAFKSRNGHHADPMKVGVKPNFIAKVPLYTGVLSEPYAKIKKENMAEARNRLSDALFKEERKEGKQTGGVNLTGFEMQVIRKFQENPDVDYRELAKLVGTTYGSLKATMTKLKSSKGIDPREYKLPEYVKPAISV